MEVYKWNEREYVQKLMERPALFPRTIKYHIRNLVKREISELEIMPNN